MFYAAVSQRNRAVRGTRIKASGHQVVGAEVTNLGENNRKIK